MERVRIKDQSDRKLQKKYKMVFLNRVEILFKNTKDYKPLKNVLHKLGNRLRLRNVILLKVPEGRVSKRAFKIYFIVLGKYNISFFPEESIPEMKQKVFFKKQCFQSSMGSIYTSGFV